MDVTKPKWHNLDQGKGINNNERGNFSETCTRLMTIRISVVFSMKLAWVAAFVQGSPHCSLASVNHCSLQKWCACWCSSSGEPHQPVRTLALNSCFLPLYNTEVELRILVLLKVLLFKQIMLQKNKNSTSFAFLITMSTFDLWKPLTLHAG